MRPKAVYQRIFEECGFVNIEFFEPTINDKTLLNKFDCLKKYQNHPLYLLIKAQKNKA